MTDMPGGSSYFHSNSDPDIIMNGDSTELWQAQHDANTLNNGAVVARQDNTMHSGGTELWQAQHNTNTLNDGAVVARQDDTMHGGGTEHWQAQHNTNTSAVVVARQDMVMNPAVNSSRVWANEERPRMKRTNLFQAKRVAVSTPGKNEAVEARIDADTTKGKAKAAIWEKQELAAQLNIAQQQIMALQMEQQRLSEQKNEEMMRQQNHWKTEWNKFSHEREIVFQRNLECLREESYEQAQAQMEAQIVHGSVASRAACEAELKTKLAEIEETHQREQDELLREQVRQQVDSHRFPLHKYLRVQQADHETKVAAFHASFSAQRRGAQQPQHNEMEDVHVPNAPPAHIPEYIAEATRQARRLEAVIRQGVDRFPVVTMAVLTQPAASAAPDTPEQSTSHMPMMIDFNDPAIEEQLKDMVYGILGKSPRKKRQAKAGATTTLIQARHDQQDQMKPTDNLWWKTIACENWWTTTGLNRARDFCDYKGVGESVMLCCEAGDTAPEGCTSKLYFGPSWATCLWNKKIVEFFVQQLLKRRKDDTNAYDVPDVSDVYLSALFYNFLKNTWTEWSRNQLRHGESVVEACKRVEAYKVDRRARNIANSHKKNNDTEGAATWKWIEQELLPKLGVAAMLSEEDEPLEVQVGDRRRMMTAHNIKKITDYVELIDKTRETCQKAPNKRFHLCSDKKSNTGPPLKLLRALYDETWISTTKEFVPDIEEELEISNEAFELMEITLA
ncbi:hypothetical protein B0H13DRAFT_1912044 [Mycena leptocephala]|nr:hypothetical protein B0H13DRAFT_1912044 [Mycena leptocephala]